MAEFEQFQDRTEAPSQKRREDAAAAGRFAVSQELLSGATLLASAIYLSCNYPAALWGFKQFFGGCVRLSATRFLDRPTAEVLINQVTQSLLSAVIPFLACTGGVGVALTVFQKGFRVSLQPLEMELNRLNPAENFGKLFSWGSAIKSVGTLLKATLVLVCSLYFSWKFIAPRMLENAHHKPLELLNQPLNLLVAVASGLSVWGLLDYLYQWWKHEQSLRMTKQELQDENKESEGSPQAKSRQRKMARELRQNGKLAEFSRATVVIKNPTHFAVALRYVRGETEAPLVVAKGRDAFALKLIAEAEAMGIPVVENRPLAQALFKRVKLGKSIPSELYLAVAQVLAYIRRLERGLAA